MLPNFLVIGAQRAGTTWLYRVLESHPEVFVTAKKEVEFFSYRERVKRGIRSYSRYFDGARGYKAVGEASPGYLWADPETFSTSPSGQARNDRIPTDVLEFLGPQVKLVVLLRDPVERALSAFLHHAVRGRISFDQSILETPRELGILEMGFYSRQLRPWFDVFPRESFHVQTFESATRDPISYFPKLFEFLGVSDGHRSVAQVTRFNAGPTFHSDTKGVRMGTFDGLRWGGKARRYRVSIEVLDFLRNLYSRDASLLAGELGIDLSPWQSTKVPS